ncbi:MAG: hypothetical protein KGJ86_03825 [Chloroflexota bacterium]|nr:hypothetical protein [Chloroflexota bacterium]
MVFDATSAVLPKLPRHKATELNRAHAKVLDEAAETGVILDATGGRPELVVAPAAEWERLLGLIQAGGVAMAALRYAVAGEVEAGSLDIPWLSALDRDDRKEFLDELSRTLSLAIGTSNPQLVFALLKGWKATAEYILAGAPLSGPIEWDEVVRVARPQAGTAN